LSRAPETSSKVQVVVDWETCLLYGTLSFLGCVDVDMVVSAAWRDAI
jgi:hypothetical protein